MQKLTGVETMLTEKENYLRVLNGEVPEWVPQYTFGKMPGSEVDPANVMIEPSLLCGHRDAGGGLDHAIHHFFHIDRSFLTQRISTPMACS